MMIRVNKKVAARKDVQYAALYSGTISHVWHDEESDSSSKPKRRNHVKLTREAELESDYDA